MSKKLAGTAFFPLPTTCHQCLARLSITGTSTRIRKGTNTPHLTLHPLSARTLRRQFTGYTQESSTRPSRRHLSTTSTLCSSSDTSPASSVTPPPLHLPPPKSSTPLRSRRLLALHGPDAQSFLHGLTTNAVPDAFAAVPASAGVYSAFLNATGRVLHDVFIYPSSSCARHNEWVSSQPGLVKFGSGEGVPSYIVDVDAHGVTSLAKLLKKYRLRAKVGIAALDEQQASVWCTWDSSTGESARHPESGSTLSLVDARFPADLGVGRHVRFTTPSEAASHMTGLEDHGGEGTYTLLRHLHGIPESQAEIQHEHALPQESNLDLLGGIDFKKGCYVGQELTIRTHHTGVVRKRILPVQLYDLSSGAPSPGSVPTYNPAEDLASRIEQGTNIQPYERRGRAAGKWLGGVGNVGLGLVRLEMMTDLVLTADGGGTFRAEDEWTLGGGIGVRAFVPGWMRAKIKVRKEMRRV